MDRNRNQEERREQRERIVLVFEEVMDHGRPIMACWLDDGSPDGIRVTSGTRHFCPESGREYDCDVVLYEQSDGRTVGKAYLHEETRTLKSAIIAEVAFRENRGRQAGLIAFDDWGAIVPARGCESKFAAGERVRVQLRETLRVAYATPVIEEPKADGFNNSVMREALAKIEPTTAEIIEVETVKGKVGVVVRTEADLDKCRERVNCYDLLGVRNPKAPAGVIHALYRATLHDLQDKLSAIRKRNDAGALIDRINVENRLRALGQARDAALKIAESRGDRNDGRGHRVRRDRQRGQSHQDRRNGQKQHAAPAKTEASEPKVQPAPVKTEAVPHVPEIVVETKPARKPIVETVPRKTVKPKAAKPKKAATEGQTLGAQLANLTSETKTNG